MGLIFLFVSVQFTSKFHGKLNNMECKSSVEIKGPSVLDGLCQLAMKGLVKLPLPNHLTAATRCARNSFTVESKKKQQRTDFTFFFFLPCSGVIYLEQITALNYIHLYTEDIDVPKHINTWHWRKFYIVVLLHSLQIYF